MNKKWSSSGAQVEIYISAFFPLHMHEHGYAVAHGKLCMRDARFDAMDSPSVANGCAGVRLGYAAPRVAPEQSVFTILRQVIGNNSDKLKWIFVCFSAHVCQVRWRACVCVHGVRPVDYTNKSSIFLPAPSRCAM